MVFSHQDEAFLGETIQLTVFNDPLSSGMLEG
jgi:hypothetical protein